MNYKPFMNEVFNLPSKVTSRQREQEVNILGPTDKRFCDSVHFPATTDS